MHLTGIFIYPVKSCRGLALDSAAFDHFGLQHDRRFLVIDESGRFLTQRTQPAMARIVTALSGSHLTLSTDAFGEVAVALPRIDGEKSSARPPARRFAAVWHDTVEADDCGDEPAGWLSAVLGQSVRLVAVGGAYRRSVRQSPADAVAFNDGYPLLLVSQESLDHLNAQLVRPLPMDRFRPNLVIAGAPAPHAEDHLGRVRLGAEVVLRAAGPCGRCAVTTTDQLTGERGVEPLRTLATYRRRAADSGTVDFGQNFIHETKSGSIRIGDPVVPIGI